MTPYEPLAAEYYDSARHPTCAAFREASLRLLSGMLEAERVVELGCGRSVFLDADAPLPRSLVLVDAETAMLAHSHPLAGRDVQFIEASADAVPTPDGTADLIIASLGDPYNLPEVWKEIARLLSPGGRVAYTTPAYAWSEAFRRKESHRPDVALFALADGTLVPTPSYVLPETDQWAMIESAGLERFDSRSALRAPEANEAPKLAAVEKGVAIVSLYVARKPA